MRKNFVLDTNVLLHDPRSLFSFADNTVVVPIQVLEEIDSFKKDQSELGRNARQVVRKLDAFREEGLHRADGVALPGGGRLKVALAAQKLPEALRAQQMVDNQILGVALEIRDRDQGGPTILVTKDVNLRVRANALGLLSEDYDAEKIDIQVADWVAPWIIGGIGWRTIGGFCAAAFARSYSSSMNSPVAKSVPTNSTR